MKSLIIQLTVLFLFCITERADCSTVIEKWEIEEDEEESIEIPGLTELKLSDVVVKTLKCQWDVNIAKEDVRFQAGVVQSSKNPFDPVLDTSFGHTRLHHIQITNLKSTRGGHLNDLDLAVTKQARLGTVYSLGGAIDQVYNPLLLGSNPFDRTNNSRLFFTIDQPLLRRLINNPEAINEKVSMIELTAGKWEMIQTFAAQIRDSVQRYWDFVSAKKVWEVRKNSYDRLRKLTVSTEKLIEGEQIAASEMNQQLAELFRERRERTRAKQGVYRTFNNLRLATGEGLLNLRCQARLRIPEMHTEEFPVKENIPEDCLIECLLQKAKQNRGDYLAARWRSVEAVWQIKSASNAILPELDIILDVNFRNHNVNDNAKPFFRSSSSARPQTDWRAAIALSVPLYNDGARGEYRQSCAELNQSYLFEEQLCETMRTDIAVALRNHYSLIEEMEDADRSVHWFEEALKSEVKRFKEGFSTLFFVIDFENRLSAAQEERILVYNAFAQNIADLYFLTGLLVTPDDELCEVEIADARSLLDLLHK